MIPHIFKCAGAERNRRGTARSRTLQEAKAVKEGSAAPRHHRRGRRDGWLPDPHHLRLAVGGATRWRRARSRSLCSPLYYVVCLGSHLVRLPATRVATMAKARRVTDTHCPYCALQCAQKLGGDPIAAEPRAFPTNVGGMCQKGWTSAELLRAQDRITTPLRRTPHRVRARQLGRGARRHRRTRPGHPDS